MKKLTYIFVLLIIVFVGCDQGKKMVAPVMPVDTSTPIQTVPVETPIAPVEVVIEAVTFENVLDLAPGVQYRLRPIDAHEGKGDEGLLYSISWGSIDENRSLREGFTEDDPKIRAWFSMVNAGKVPYAKTLDGKPVIAKNPVWDEIVIEIVENQWGGGIQETGGPRGDRFEFTLVEYSAILIENLTHPDRKFEYE